MQKKHLGKIIGLLALLFASTFGQTVETLMKQGASYETGMGYGFLLSLANLALISAIMMAVPLICRIVRKEKLEFKRGKRLCLWNSIILFIFSSIFLIMTETNFIGGIGAIIYYFINRWAFVNDKEHSLPTHTSTQEDTHMSLSPKSEMPSTNDSGSTFGIDIALDTNATPHHTDVPQQTIENKKPTPSKPYVKYCSRCGNPIDPVFKKCSGCGKQYFKGISLKTFLIGAVIFCLILSIILNVILVVKLQKKPTYIVRDEEDSFSSWLEKQELQEKADFMDTYIVFVEDDNTNLYHKYDCSRFKQEYFLAFNIDAAKDQGYSPCSLCIH